MATSVRWVAKLNPKQPEILFSLFSASCSPHKTFSPDIGCVRYTRTRFLFFRRPQYFFEVVWTICSLTILFPKTSVSTSTTLPPSPSTAKNWCAMTTIHRELADGDLLVIVLRPEVRGQVILWQKECFENIKKMLEVESVWKLIF